MRICFVVSQLFHFGVYGGFGFLTRTIGRELAKRNIEVFILMPRNAEDQRIIETIDGMTVFAIPFKTKGRFRFRSLYRLCEAEIYHSEEPSIDTYVAMRMNPRSKHIITFQDPRTLNDHRKVWSLDPRWSSYRFRVMMEASLRFKEFIVRRTVHKADALYSQAKYIIPKIASIYKLNKMPKFLPNPVEIPERTLKKADEPTVCFLARWDPVKRPELFFDLAEEFPEVKFIIPGKSHDKNRDQYLRERGRRISNLEMPGFVNEEEKSRILEKSWILVNTSLRECLPVSFLETAAHKCAILSSNNPDDFASNFGRHVTNGNYASELRLLLEKDAWKEKGEKGYEYVKEVHELNKVINQHIKVYQKVLES